MKRYTAGFLFHRRVAEAGYLHPSPRPHTSTDVLLVRKAVPLWQAGLLNAVGGKIEEGEEPLQAHLREMRKEIGMTENPGWHCFCVESYGTRSSSDQDAYQVHFFRAFTDDRLQPRYVPPLQNDQGEFLGWMPVAQVGLGSPFQVVGSLHWLIPLALDWRQSTGTLHVGGDIRVSPTWERDGTDVPKTTAPAQAVPEPARRSRRSGQRAT